jgi:hypothetical protein
VPRAARTAASRSAHEETSPLRTTVSFRNRDFHAIRGVQGVPFECFLHGASYGLRGVHRLDMEEVIHVSHACQVANGAHGVVELAPELDRSLEGHHAVRNRRADSLLWDQHIPLERRADGLRDVRVVPFESDRR